jgi:hypothetical protein
MKKDHLKKEKKEKKIKKKRRSNGERSIAVKRGQNENKKNLCCNHLHDSEDRIMD